MKKVSMLANATVTSILVTTAVAAPVFACHPQGQIIKSVQNQTAGTASSDANIVSTSISAAPNDTLVYSITVKNSGAAASNGDDDMLNTVLTDTLPAGVQLVSNPAERTVTENLGTIKPGASVTKTYAVQVTDTTDGDIITNKACYTGNSKDNQDNQSGCDVAIVKVHVPPVTPPVIPPVTPPTLPDTGSTATTAGIVVVAAAALGYALNVVRLRRRTDA